MQRYVTFLFGLYCLQRGGNEEKEGQTKEQKEKKCRIRREGKARESSGMKQTEERGGELTTTPP